MIRTFQKLMFRLRMHWCIADGLRKLAWRLQGATIGARTNLPRVFVTWPHQLSIGADCVLERDIAFKFDGFWRPGPSIRIDDGCFIGRACEFNITRSVAIGARSLIASGCKFIDHDHAVPPVAEGDIGGAGAEAPIRVGENVWLGANVIVLKGVQLGDGCVVAAGAVVTRSVPAYEIWAGVPARKVGARPGSTPVSRLRTVDLA